jgi:hypothetical protein
MEFEHDKVRHPLHLPFSVRLSPSVQGEESDQPSGVWHPEKNQPSGVRAKVVLPDELLGIDARQRAVGSQAESMFAQPARQQLGDEPRARRLTDDHHALWKDGKARGLQSATGQFEVGDRQSALVLALKYAPSPGFTLSL